MGRHAVADLLSAMFEYGLDLRKRRVFLQCGIGEHDNPGQNIAELVTRGLLYLDKTQGDIELWINTPGGDVDDMFAIYDVIRTCENNVSTIGHGVVASAGTLILAGGTKRMRYATPNTIFMVHEFQDGVNPRVGTRLQKVQINQKERSEDRWARLMGRACGRKQLPDTRGNGSARVWEQFWLESIRTKPEFYLDSKDMLRHGVIDEIWPPDEDETDE